MEIPSRLGHLPAEVASAVGMLREVAELPEGHPKAVSLRRVAFRLLVGQFRSLAGVSAKLRKERAEIVAGRLADASPSSDLLPEIAEAICWLIYYKPSEKESVFSVRKEKAKKASWAEPAKKEAKPAIAQKATGPIYQPPIEESVGDSGCDIGEYSPEEPLDEYFHVGSKSPAHPAPRRRG